MFKEMLKNVFKGFLEDLEENPKYFSFQVDENKFEIRLEKIE